MTLVFACPLFLISILTASTAASSNGIRGTLRPLPKRAGAALPSGWKLGAECVSDAAAPNRLLSWSDSPTNITVNSCLDECAFHGFVYAGMEFGQQCWCGNSLSTAGGAGVSLPSSSCNVPCQGDITNTTRCGGSWALSLYERALGSSPYTRATIHAGESFFNGWSFFSSDDPTGGDVAYQPESNATSQRLAYVRDDGVVVLKVDNTTTLQPGQKRASVRISTTATYTTALMIFDVLSMPWGCSVWPALWTVGPNWPEKGEIDVIEGVNNVTHNQMTFHTGANTACDISNIQGNWVSTGFGSRVCASSPTNNPGCGYNEPPDAAAATYGESFNAAGGAVYALLLNHAGSTIWRWKHDEVPSEIAAGLPPKPDGWGLPAAMLLSDASCPTQSLIRDQSIVIDTTLCGGWCRDTYTSLGCGTECAERIPDPRNYDNAYWLIKNITIWQ